MIKQRMMRWGEMRNMYKMLAGKPEGKRPVGKPRCRWDDNIKIDLQEIRFGVWIGLIWLRTRTDSKFL
jgi:hypothetical protein